MSCTNVCVEDEVEERDRTLCLCNYPTSTFHAPRVPLSNLFMPSSSLCSTRSIGGRYPSTFLRCPMCAVGKRAHVIAYDHVPWSGSERLLHNACIACCGSLDFESIGRLRSVRDTSIASFPTWCSLHCVAVSFSPAASSWLAAVSQPRLPHRWRRMGETRTSWQLAAMSITHRTLWAGALVFLVMLSDCGTGLSLLRMALVLSVYELRASADSSQLDLTTTRCH
jgi:hypothetical protein